MGKRTYTLADATLTKFEHMADNGRRSAIVNTLVEDWIRNKEREELHRHIVAGCRDMADEMIAIEREFLSADEELHRVTE